MVVVVTKKEIGEDCSLTHTSKLYLQCLLINWIECLLLDFGLPLGLLALVR